ncbi:tabersonine-19-hydroxy-O-acetyltransferase-like [Cryptomeria japonica]|uniref:tabersonine-19-hydroxy-O-acetyltransferase-like n=1 Tax=Cryptomeria japonica TaxID=3369 RepID=UPI0025ABB1EF|nr:tabersonine-19-hydroxy-O-acetyltransferase-like [Cryptomeria japonica]
MEATAQMEQITVKLLRVSTVAPAVQSCRQRMFLSNLDLFWLQTSKPQRLLFYRVLPANEYSSIVDSLKKSLSSVLVHFYPFAGQLVIGEISGRPEIDCNDGGVEFVEASMDIPFNDLEKEEFQHKPFLKTLVQIVHPSQRHENFNTPLLSIQNAAETYLFQNPRSTLGQCSNQNTRQR